MKAKRPLATAQVRNTWKVVNENGRRHRRSTGLETVRRAECPTHKLETSEFEGVNEYGWVFACRGAEVRDHETGETKEARASHRFVAEPGR